MGLTTANLRCDVMSESDERSESLYVLLKQLQTLYCAYSHLLSTAMSVRLNALLLALHVPLQLVVRRVPNVTVISELEIFSVGSKL